MFRHLNYVLMLNEIVCNRTDYLHKNDLALNNLQKLICYKTLPTNQTKPVCKLFVLEKNT